MLEKNYTEKFYFNNLDTLRFFAFLSVFCSHCVGVFGYKFHNKYLELIHRHFFVNGDLGVGFFFVLSGFLITWLLLIEKEKNGNINVLHFYMRRVLRIWAVYFLVVLIGFSIGMQSPVPYHSDISQLKWYLTFLANYDLVFNGQTNPLVNILWSVAIEEQYYVIWPLFFLFFKKKLLPFVCMIIIIISFIFRYNHT